MQKAVGVIREGIVMPLADELDNWVGADEVVLSTLPTGNNLVPRQSAENMRVSLFGVSNDNNNSKKRGRPTGLKNQKIKGEV